MDITNMLVFNEKKRIGNGRGSSDDVTVSMSHYKDGSKRYNFIFRNEVWKSICPEIGRIAYACIFNAIVFKQSESGYKLSYESKTNTNKKIQVLPPNEAIENQLIDMVGNYDLKFDKNIGLYYIEKE